MINDYFWKFNCVNESVVNLMYAFVSLIWGKQEGNCIVLCFRQLIWTFDEIQSPAF